ncbi:MAG TPA: ParB/RepB/Spo0J family partition protein [Acidimicrobiales bacterium]|nr:ParB/RepB/Spo0J family partition protein [Acidimicrobiales bacterium]
MARRSGLGKGLGSLIPTAAGGESAGESDGTYREIPIVEITPNRHQPRARFDEESLVTLTASVREVGVIQPVLVRPTGDGAFELIAGERRWRAAKRAGLTTIPALVRDTDELGAVEQALIENLHREDLNPLEEAGAYQQLIEDFGLTHDELATRVGRSRVAITNTLRLFQLPPSIQRLVGEGRLSAGHARALLGTPDRAYQEALAKRILSEGLSVRAVEEAVRARQGLGDPGTSPPAKPRLRPPGLLELEELLSERLDTRVKVDMGARRGKVVIEFASLEDLERIYRLMTTGPRQDHEASNPQSVGEA